MYTDPMILWYAIVGLLLLAFLIDSLFSVISRLRHRPSVSHHLVEIGKEREMFFIPGDPRRDNDDDDPDEL